MSVGRLFTQILVCKVLSMIGIQLVLFGNNAAVAESAGSTLGNVGAGSTPVSKADPPHHARLQRLCAVTQHADSWHAVIGHNFHSSFLSIFDPTSPPSLLTLSPYVYLSYVFFSLMLPSQS